MIQMDKTFSFVIVMIFFTRICNTANIFCIFPTASFSHQQPMLALSRALAGKGHNLTVITTNPSEVPIKNHNEISLNFMYSEFLGKDFEKKTGISAQKRLTWYQMITAYPGIFDNMLHFIFKAPHIQDLIRKVNGTKYDLIIYEPIYGGSFLGIADLIGRPPIIGIVSVHLKTSIDISLGNPVIPSYMPSLYSSYQNPMSFWERTVNLFIELYFNYVHEVQVIPVLQKHLDANFGCCKRSIRELENNKNLMIVSSDFITSFPRPLQPNTIYVGPLHIHKNPQQLPQDIQKWMDEADEGVIYFSLGNNVKGALISEDKREAFIRAFEQFPRMRVLWKWESKEKMPRQPNNVLVKKWFPQQSVLAHHKVRLFISQVGLQSFQEAIHYGVPVLAIPMFADQDFNAKKLFVSGGGLSVEFETISNELIKEKLMELLTNKSYKNNMLRLSSIMNDKPLSSVDSAVWWVEYVLRHNGAPHIKPAAVDLSWYQYYMLDILLVMIIFSVILFYSVFYISRILFTLLLSVLFSSSKGEITKEKKIS